MRAREIESKLNDLDRRFQQSGIAGGSPGEDGGRFRESKAVRNPRLGVHTPGLDERGDFAKRARQRVATRAYVASEFGGVRAHTTHRRLGVGAADERSALSPFGNGAILHADADPIACREAVTLFAEPLGPR